MRAADPTGAAELERLLAAHDVIGITAQYLARYGLKANDVADTMAVYAVTAWYGARGRDDDPSATRLKAIREQMANAIAGDADFSTATDARKQEVAEAMLL